MTSRLRETRRALAVVVTTLIALLTAMAGAAAAETATYSAIETVPVPPASNFAGSGGGDGWAVALSESNVYNVFHHESSLQVACHVQATAAACGLPKTVSEPGGSGFSTAAQPGLYLDQHTGKLYVYATRTSDNTAGVVCVDTTSNEVDPFCGFTELSGKGEAPLASFAGISGVSNPMLIGAHWYAFNFVAGKQEGTKDALLCFDVTTHAACSGQPYSVAIGEGEVSTNSWPPSGETAAIGGKAIIPVSIGGGNTVACFDDATQGNCAGKWPVKLGFNYVFSYGAPFPFLTAAGKTTGLCFPTGTDQCLNLEGEEVATPEHMSEAIEASSGWDGPGFVLGPRVYTPNGDSDAVDCFDYATGKSCPNFPKAMSNLGLLYTVNADPQRPTCIWVNSDDGSAQIQNFDAYTGGPCGEGTIRVLASQFVVTQPQCTPASYISLQVLKPGRGTYASGSVAFADGDGNPIGLEERALDETGTASLAGLELNTPTGLPEFLFTLNGEQEKVGLVEVKLTWSGDYDKTCVGEKTEVTAPPQAERTTTTTTTSTSSSTAQTTATTSPAPAQGVLAFGAAHLATHVPACLAHAGYRAVVSGSSIASVTFTLDGRKVATLSKPNSHGSFAAHLNIRAGRHHHLTMHVVFSAASKAPPVTIARTLARCAAVHVHAKPRFTG